MQTFEIIIFTYNYIFQIRLCCMCVAEFRCWLAVLLLFFFILWNLIDYSFGLFFSQYERVVGYSLLLQRCCGLPEILFGVQGNHTTVLCIFGWSLMMIGRILLYYILLLAGYLPYGPSGQCSTQIRCSFCSIHLLACFHLFSPCFYSYPFLL